MASIRSMQLRTSTQVMLSLLVLLGATFVLYSATLKNGFVLWDDGVYVYDNYHIQTLTASSLGWLFTHPYFASWTPLTLVSHAIDYRIWHLDARGHHLTSLLLHSANACWVYLLTLLLLVKGRGKEGEIGLRPLTVAASLLAALFYAIHPLRAEPVAWVSDRKDLLSAFFLLPATISYLWYVGHRATPAGRKWYGLALLLFVLALLCKSTAVTWPVVLLLIDVFVLQPKSWRRDLPRLIMEKAAFFVASAAIGVVAVLSAPTGEMNDFLVNLAPIGRAFFFTFNIMFYLVKSVWPFSLAATYEPPGGPTIVASVVGVAAITGICILLAVRGRRLPLGAWLCYLAALFPSMGVFRSIIQPTADRYSYVPLVAFVPLVAGGLAWLLVKVSGRIGMRTTVLVLLGGGIVGLGVLARDQVAYWHNSEALWRNAVRVSPGIPFPYYNLGLALHDNGDLVGAMAMYQRAIVHKPHYPDPHNGMGNIYREWGDTARALTEFSMALSYKPDLVAACINIGSIYLARNEVDTAIQYYARAAKLEPQNPDALYHLGNAYKTRGNLADALGCFRQVVALNPNHQRAYLNMGMVYMQQGNSAAAVEAFRQAARLGNIVAIQSLEERGIDW